MLFSRSLLVFGALLGSVSLQGANSVAGSTVVLPFTNRLPSHPAPAGNTNDWIGESIAEALREALSASGVPVIPRGDVTEAYETLHLSSNAELTQASALKLGQTVNAERIIAGTFRTDAAGTLTIETTVIDRGRSRINGPFLDSGLTSGIDLVEGHLAWRMVSILAPLAAPTETSFHVLRPPVRAAAEENFIRGLLSTSAAQKERYYQQANRIDPRFARPVLELGKIDLSRRSYKSAAVWFSKVEPKDLHYAEASFYSGVAKFRDGDYVSAQGAFDRITKSLPAAEVFNNLGATESRLNVSHALVSFRQAVEIDPSQSDYHFNLGYALFKTGQFNEAADRFRAVLERDPSDQMATVMLGRSIKREGLRSGNPADARFESAERFKETYQQPTLRSTAR